jgi:hypothetical protein
MQRARGFRLGRQSCTAFGKRAAIDRDVADVTEPSAAFRT